MSGILSGDGHWVMVGDVILQNTTWGRRDLVNGEDFTQMPATRNAEKG